jgi:3-methyl-2-oxobutanoate hydroxymethyltransferase
VQGRDEERRTACSTPRKSLESAGADIVLLECIPSELGQKITRACTCRSSASAPGPDVDGQILVLYDVLDITTGRKPRFVKNFMEGATSNRGRDQRYVKAVKDRSYPAPEHEFHA